MDFELLGLPVHPLIVHGVVVIVPLAALVLALGSVAPPARRRLGVATPIVALVALVLTPLAISSGEALMGRVGPIPSVLEHQALAVMLPPWVIAMFVVAAGQWAWFRYRRAGDKPGAVDRVVPTALAVVALGAALGSVWMVFLIGEAGARSVWG